MSANVGSADSQALANAGKNAPTMAQEFASPSVPADVHAHARDSLDARLLRRLLSSLGNPPIEFHFLWSGERVTPLGVQPVGHVRIADRRTLLGIVLDPQVRFPDSYCAGRIEVEGDLVDFLVILYRIFEASDTGDSMAGRVIRKLQRPRRNTLAGSRENIHRHYDLGNEFYSLWLGETMAYTCAYYPTAQATLEQAQVAKMDHVCRKLRITSADSVVEAGCGWGSLALHIASRYGAKVRAFNISREQIAYARDRARQQGLQNRVEFIEDDYRNISGSCEVFVSVGMLEHVGLENYPQLGRLVQRSLTAAGRGLIHSIGRNQPGSLHPWIERRIFPGAQPPSIGQMMQIFEPANLSVLDVENIRQHYALTLRHWLENYENAIESVRKVFADEFFVRMWRWYLAGSVAAFETGTLQLFQVLFTKAKNNALPLTRDFMYPK
ncbi:MAG: class I SAM-dependent methyltransferase [Steroidobacteraceae bacterium]